MKNIIILTKQTMQEAFARKVFITFFIVSAVTLILGSLLFMLTPLANFTTGMEESMKHSKIPITMDPLIMVVQILKNLIVFPLYTLGLFLSIFSVSSFIPNLLEKGHIDIILSKPVARSQVLIGKYLGGLIVVLLNVTFLVGGIWLLIGLKFSVWDTNFLYIILTVTFAFATLYSLIILIGILSQSHILSMMLCYIIFIAFSPVISKLHYAEFITNKFYKALVDILYYIHPKTADIWGMTESILKGEAIASYQPIYTSAAFLVLIFGLSIFIFSKKDY